MSTYGIGLSGGDRIFIELTKRLAKKYSVSIYLWEEGLEICKREDLKNVKFVIWSSKFWAKFGFFKSVTFVINYFSRIFIAVFNSFKLKIDNSPNIIVYSASEFWQDSLPALILKLRYPKIKWIAAWYQTAPNPFIGFRENGQFKLIPSAGAFAYWVVQQPVKPLIRRYADFIFLTSEPDKLQFPQLNNLNRLVVIKGGVDLDKVKLFQKKFSNLPKIYDAVFQGRFHPQKGVIELIDIWKIVVAKKKDTKLVMIGDGPLMNDVREKIKDLKLEKNIKLLGYIFDGPEKYKIFQQSKIVVHPALYDSGGMAAAEAMAFGLPGISFDLEALKTYYPEGMIKVPIGDRNNFALAIVALLKDNKMYKKIQQEASKIIYENWSWDSLSNMVEQIIR